MLQAIRLAFFSQDAKPLGVMAVDQPTVDGLLEFDPPIRTAEQELDGGATVKRIVQFKDGGAAIITYRTK